MSTFEKTFSDIISTASCLVTGNGSQIIRTPYPATENVSVTLTESGDITIATTVTLTYTIAATDWTSNNTHTVKCGDVALVVDGAEHTASVQATISNKTVRLTLVHTFIGGTMPETSYNGKVRISGKISGTYAAAVTKPGAPTKVSMTPQEQIQGQNVTLNFSGATAGTNNAVAGFHIQYRVSADGSTWGNWTPLTAAGTHPGASAKTYTVATTNYTVGSYYQFRIRTYGTVSDENLKYSDWVAFPGKLLIKEIPDEDDPDADPHYEPKTTESEPFDTMPPFITAYIWRRTE